MPSTTASSPSLLPESARDSKAEPEPEPEPEPPAAIPPAVPEPIAVEETGSQLARIAIKRRRTSSAIIAVIEDKSGPTNFESALKFMRKATDRDYLGDQVVMTMRDFLTFEFDVGAILIARDSRAIGWKGFTRGGGNGWVSSVSVSLQEPSVVHHSYTQKDIYVGPPTDIECAANRHLWTTMGGDVPGQIATAPVIIDQRIVCLLYLHSQRPGQVEAVEDICAQLGLLARATSKSLVRLMRAAQR